MKQMIPPAVETVEVWHRMLLAQRSKSHIITFVGAATAIVAVVGGCGGGSGGGVGSGMVAGAGAGQ